MSDSMIVAENQEAEASEGFEILGDMQLALVGGGNAVATLD
jgi:hypothetical protein